MTTEIEGLTEIQLQNTQDTHEKLIELEKAGLIKKKEPNTPQQTALRQLQQHRDKGLNKSLVVLPSGAGKTYLAAFDTKQAGAKSVLFLVHRREILQQAADTFKFPLS